MSSKLWIGIKQYLIQRPSEILFFNPANKYFVFVVQLITTFPVATTPTTLPLTSFLRSASSQNAPPRSPALGQIFLPLPAYGQSVRRLQHRAMLVDRRI